jgi:antitoxin PrlF
LPEERIFLTYLDMISSRLTTKAQTTIPQAVRAALKVRPGDTIAYQIEGDRVVLTKAPGETTPEDPFATFTEWDGEADRKAYADL